MTKQGEEMRNTLLSAIHPRSPHGHLVSINCMSSCYMKPMYNLSFCKPSGIANCPGLGSTFLAVMLSSQLLDACIQRFDGKSVSLLHNLRSKPPKPMVKSRSYMFMNIYQDIQKVHLGFCDVTQLHKHSGNASNYKVVSLTIEM